MTVLSKSRCLDHFPHRPTSWVPRGAPPLTRLRSPSACLWNSRTFATMANLALKQSSTCALHGAPLPPTIRGVPRGSRNASLRKGCALACFLCFKIIALPAGRTFRAPRGTRGCSRLRARLGTGYPLAGGTRTNVPKDTLRCRVPARRAGRRSTSSQIE